MGHNRRVLLALGLAITMSAGACSSDDGGGAVDSAAATTAAPAATTTAAPAATTTAAPEEVALANLANIGTGALVDEIFIENVRETMPVDGNNMYSDWDLFDLAEGVCYMAITEGIGAIEEVVKKANQTQTRKQFRTQFVLIYNAIHWYCNDYVDEFVTFAEKEGY